jgi:riboflavin biosynthesis pyrimidine reductase
MRRLFPHPAVEVDPVDAYQLPVGPGVHVRGNMVTSVDGAAAFEGRVAPISGPADERVFHLLRALTDVILVGAGTVRVEGYHGPLLSEDGQRWRQAAGLEAHPRLAVLSGRLDLDFTSPLFTDPPRRPLLVTASSAPPERRESAARVADIVIAGDDRVDLTAAVSSLADRGMRHVLCEGGPHLLGQLFVAAAVDELCLTVAPTVVCGEYLRITSGLALAAPGRLRLSQVLEEEDFLFLTYGAR